MMRQLSSLIEPVCKWDIPNITQESSPGLIFQYPADDSLDPTVDANVDAARTNAFYGETTKIIDSMK